MANYDEEVRFNQGGDVGDNTSGSIQPVLNAEVLEQDVLGRPGENTRKRLEVIRKALINLNYYTDYDRALIIRCDWEFTLSQPNPGEYVLSATGVGDLEIFPALSPGLKSGGRYFGGRVFVGNSPYFGTLGLDDLTLTCNSFYTGQRGYADGEDFAVDVNSLTLGANDIQVDLIAESRPGGIGTIIYQVEQTPKRRIKIKYGTAAPATTLSDLILGINNDVTSQGTYGVAHYFRASTTVLSPASVTPSPALNARVQGAYDAEVHKITLGQFNAFFAIAANYMADGEGLAIGFPLGPIEKGPAIPTGGRRQSLTDLPIDRIGGFSDNTSGLVNGGLFITGREPEKIPGAIPIGKMVRGKFVFIEGTYLADTETTTIGGNANLIAALASQTPTTGADLIGYGGSPPWHVYFGGSLPASTVEQAIDNLVLALADSSGSHKIGSTAVVGTPEVGNKSLDLANNVAIKQQLAAMLNDPNAINHRVHESGHYLQTVDPIQKRLDQLASAGGRRFQSISKETDSIAYSSMSQLDYADLILQPVKNGNLNLNEPIIAGASVQDVRLNAGDINARFPNIWPIFPYMNVYPEADALSLTAAPIIFVEIKGLVAGPSGDGPGIYQFDQFMSLITKDVRLRKLDNTYPDFTGANFGAATLTFMHGMSLGNSHANGRMHLFNANQANGGASMVLLGANRDTVLMETYYNDNAVFPGLAKKGMIFRGDSIVFQPLTGNPKSTDHILVQTDYNYLRGFETGTPINATVNHHHGTVYNGFRDKNGASLGTITTPAVAGTLTYGVGVTPGETQQFCVVYVTGDVKALAAGDCTFQLELRKNGGNNIAGVAIKFTAAAPAETRKIRLQAIVPLSSNQFEIEKIGLLNVDPTTVINVLNASLINGLT